MIVPGSASQELAAALSAALDEPLAAVEYERFADGERLVRVRETANRAVVVAATVSDGAHVELLQLQDAVRNSDEVVTVLPYMGYARQDETFEPGEPVSARAMARAISTGTDRVVTVNPHEPGVGDFFEVPFSAVDAAPRLADPLDDDLADPLFLSPDRGALGLAETVRDAYGRGEADHFEKRRVSDTEVNVSPGDAPTSGRDVVLVDDIVATGSTMSTAIEQLSAPNRVFVACVHPMLAAGARTKLANAGAETVYGTDTVERAVSTVSAAPAVASSL